MSATVPTSQNGTTTLGWGGERKDEPGPARNQSLSLSFSQSPSLLGTGGGLMQTSPGGGGGGGERGRGWR